MVKTIIHVTASTKSASDYGSPTPSFMPWGINESLLPRKGIVDGRVVLQELTSVTGGKAFSPNSQSGMSDALERIALELRHQYSIGYRPANLVTDAKWHHLKVKVTPPPGFRRVFVRSRDGYY